MDKIFIHDFSLKASIGVYEKEKRAKQRIILNISAELHPGCNGHISDNVDDTVSYEIFVSEAEKLAASGHFELAEHFAEKLAQNLLKNARLNSVEIKLEKPDILKKYAKSVGVKIIRTR